MKEYLSQRGVEFITKEITQDPVALEELSTLGHMTTPVTVIAGEVVVGFDQKKLDRLIGQII